MYSFELKIHHFFKLMKETIFFRISAWTTFFFSCYTWWLLYNQGTGWWIGLGVILLITLLTLIMGPKSIIRMLYIPNISYPVSRVIIVISAIGFFLSALIGLLNLVSQLPINDNNNYILPILIISLVFAGSAFGVFHSDN